MLKLISLNIEGDNHLDRVLPFLKKEQADVVCLMEVLEKDTKLFESSLQMYSHFAPMFKTDWDETRERESRGELPPGTRQGVAILSKNPFVATEYIYNNLIEIPKRSHPNRTRRIVLQTTITKDEVYTIATTHFTWSPGGTVIEEQLRDAQQLIDHLNDTPELILCGDFNAPRPNAVYQLFTKRFHDNIPQDVRTTLDQHLHKVSGLQYVVDYLFTTPAYSVKEIKIVDGVSDHMALVAQIEKTAV